MLALHVVHLGWMSYTDMVSWTLPEWLLSSESRVSTEQPKCDPTPTSIVQWYKKTYSSMHLKDNLFASMLSLTDIFFKTEHMILWMAGQQYPFYIGFIKMLLICLDLSQCTDNNVLLLAQKILPIWHFVINFFSSVNPRKVLQGGNNPCSHPQSSNRNISLCTKNN